MPLRVSKKRFSLLRVQVGAFLLAILLWLYVALNETYTTEIDGKVEPFNLRYGKTFAAPLPETITVNVTGRGVDLMWLFLFWKSDLKFNLDLKTISNYFELPVKNYLSWVSVPRAFDNRLSVSSIVYPDVITIDLDDLDSVKVPVSEDNLMINIPEGYTKVGRIAFQPDSIVVSGPRSRVREMREIRTVQKTYDSEQDDFSETVPLEKSGDSLVSYSTTDVRMSVSIQKIGEKTLGNVPVTILQKPPAFSVTFRPSTLSLRITGGIDYIQDFSPGDFSATIVFDKSWVRGGEYYAHVNMDIPEYIINYEVSPSDIMVAVQ